MVSQTALRYDEQDWTPRPTLSGAEYTSEAVWDEERERIWWGDWVCIGREEELPNPGDYIVRDLTGESIFLTRDEGGALHGFYNVCSHRGTKFLDDEPAAGHVRKAFTCPYHGWVYGLDGSLLGTPNVQEYERFERRDYPLHSFPIETFAGFIFVNLTTGTPRPLLEQMSEGAESLSMFDRFKLDELRIGVRMVYEVEANWKIVVENYNECLHCPTVHPELVRIVPLYRHGEVEDAPDMNGNGNSLAAGMTSFTPTGRSSLPPLPGISEDDRHTFYGVTLLPNLIANYHSDCVSTFLLLPHGPGSTRVVCHYLFAPETVAAAGFDPSEVVEFRHRLAQQDWAVCERAQLSMASRAYAGGGILPYADRFVHAFHRQYLAMRDEGSA
jgi:glycine betaine catabolism A